MLTAEAWPVAALQSSVPRSGPFAKDLDVDDTLLFSAVLSTRYNSSLVVRTTVSCNPNDNRFRSVTRSMVRIQYSHGNVLLRVCEMLKTAGLFLSLPLSLSPSFSLRVSACTRAGTCGGCEIELMLLSTTPSSNMQRF